MTAFLQGAADIGEREPNEGPTYPAGTRIRLEGETLRRLAIGENLPAVGTVMQLHAEVEVVAVSTEPQAIEDRRAVELQLRTIDLEAPEPAPGDKADMARRLFPSQR